MGFAGDRTGENSVEDILSSIKKVIARDNRAAAAYARERPAAEPYHEAGDGDGESAAAFGEDVLDLEDGDMVGQAPGEAEPADEPRENDAQGDGPLTSDRAQAAMRDNLAALAMLAQPGVAPQIVRAGETSLEQLTRDLLRPMLAQWLDTHLPPLVEQMVRAEIERITAKRS